ncbi:MAG: Hsp33 family molecular chaperone HslO [Richelia sp. SL_2_1]|nr:Hsp33 family molecular chaperone HslO [Richelia sp. SM1_7_0]NJO26461.1 Hsp33 family molecular chaperone HslO [Richelia sp. SL_2_1]
MKNQKNVNKRNLWFERFMALTATLNLGLVLFNLTYIELRDFYLRNLPQIQTIYDPIKGIEPHRETENYLKTVEELEQQIAQTGLTSALSTSKLEELSDLSVEMIENNPFAGVSKSGTLEKIKNRMSERLDNESSKRAFISFWSQEYLLKQGWNQEISFFNRKIKPLIATNYYRQIGENGEFIDKFWIIDLPFVLLFTVELLARSYYIKRRHPGFSWFNAVLWRWYDLFLVLPFWRWLRIIPVLFRLEKVELLNLHSLRHQIQQGIVANFAEEITQIVVIRVINQTQNSIKQGDLTRWLQQSQTLRPYVDLNNINEIEALAGIFVQTVIYQVLPKIQPEIIALLQHNINSAFNQSPIYSNFRNLPGIGQMQHQLSEQLATQIATNLYHALVSATEDPVSVKLSSQLVKRFSEAMTSEIQKKQVISEIQSLLIDFLEEMKINYVQRLSEEDVEQILEQTRNLQTEVSLPLLADTKRRTKPDI